MADLAAKKAHELENSTTITQDTNNIIKDIKDKIKRQWEEQIQRTLITKTYYLKDNTPQPWSRSENRKLDVCLTRILTKHTRLKKHLHRLNLETDPNCRWCQFPEETIEHLTLQCPRFHSERTKLLEALKKIKITNPNIPLLITGENQPPAKKYYILRHMKIFLQRTRIINII